jgi:hypothetical protein
MLGLQLHPVRPSNFPASGVLGILARLGFEEMLHLALGLGINYFALKTSIVGVLTEHPKLVATFEISGDKKTEFGVFINGASGTKIVRFVDSMETSPANPDHFLNLFFRLIFRDPEQCNVVDHDWVKNL